MAVGRCRLAATVVVLALAAAAAAVLVQAPRCAARGGPRGHRPGSLTAAVVVAVYGVVDRSWSEDNLAQLTVREAVPVVDVIQPERGVAGE